MEVSNSCVLVSQGHEKTHPIRNKTQIRKWQGNANIEIGDVFVPADDAAD